MISESLTTFKKIFFLVDAFEEVFNPFGMVAPFNIFIRLNFTNKS
jgi:hypothetical protein